MPFIRILLFTPIGIARLTSTILRLTWKTVFSLRLHAALLLANIYVYKVAKHAKARAKFMAAITCVKEASTDAEVMRAVLQNLPAWVQFSDYEKAEWLNGGASLLWPWLDRLLARVLKQRVEPLVRRHLPTMLAGFEFEKLSFGTAPPWIGGVKTIDMKHADELVLVLDLDVKWAATPDIVLRFMTDKTRKRHVTPYMRVKADTLQIATCLRLTIGPFLPKLPLVGGMSFAFMSPPHYDFSIKTLGGAADVMSVPALKDWLFGLLNAHAMPRITFPKSVKLRFGRRTPTERGMPIGIITLTISSACLCRKASRGVESMHAVALLEHAEQGVGRDWSGSQSFATERASFKNHSPASKRMRHANWHTRVDLVVHSADQVLKVFVCARVHGYVDVSVTTSDVLLGGVELPLDAIITAAHQRTKFLDDLTAALEAEEVAASTMDRAASAMPHASLQDTASTSKAAAAAQGHHRRSKSQPITVLQDMQASLHEARTVATMHAGPHTRLSTLDGVSQHAHGQPHVPRGEPSQQAVARVSPPRSAPASPSKAPVKPHAAAFDAASLFTSESSTAVDYSRSLSLSPTIHSPASSPGSRLPQLPTPFNTSPAKALSEHGGKLARASQPLPHTAPFSFWKRPETAHSDPTAARQSMPSVSIPKTTSPDTPKLSKPSPLAANSVLQHGGNATGHAAVSGARVPPAAGNAAAKLRAQQMGSDARELKRALRQPRALASVAERQEDVRQQKRDKLASHPLLWQADASATAASSLHSRIANDSFAGDPVTVAQGSLRANAVRLHAGGESGSWACAATLHHAGAWLLLDVPPRVPDTTVADILAGHMTQPAIADDGTAAIGDSPKFLVDTAVRQLRKQFSPDWWRAMSVPWAPSLDMPHIASMPPLHKDKPTFIEKLGKKLSLWPSASASTSTSMAGSPRAASASQHVGQNARHASMTAMTDHLSDASAAERDMHAMARSTDALQGRLGSQGATGRVQAADAAAAAEQPMADSSESEDDSKDDDKDNEVVNEIVDNADVLAESRARDWTSWMKPSSWLPSTSMPHADTTHNTGSNNNKPTNERIKFMRLKNVPLPYKPLGALQVKAEFTPLLHTTLPPLDTMMPAQATAAAARSAAAVMQQLHSRHAGVLMCRVLSAALDQSKFIYPIVRITVDGQVRRTTLRERWGAGRHAVHGGTCEFDELFSFALRPSAASSDIDIVITEVQKSYWTTTAAALEKAGRVVAQGRVPLQTALSGSIYQPHTSAWRLWSPDVATRSQHPVSTAQGASSSDSSRHTHAAADNDAQTSPQPSARAAKLVRGDSDSTSDVVEEDATPSRSGSNQTDDGLPRLPTPKSSALPPAAPALNSMRSINATTRGGRPLGQITLQLFWLPAAEY